VAKPTRSGSIDGIRSGQGDQATAIAPSPSGPYISGVPSFERAHVRTIVLAEMGRVARIDLSSMPDSAKLRDDVPVDSLRLLDVLVAIESALGVEIDEDLLNAVETVGDLVDCILASPLTKGPV
jgi:acyl carrier protein